MTNIASGKEFSELGELVDETLLKCISDDFGYKHMAPVQQISIPLLLGNKDVVCQAVTGSGKTLAYALPVLQTCIKYRDVHFFDEDENEIRLAVLGCIICPTRELAQQVQDQLIRFEKYIPKEYHVRSALITGGRDRLDSYNVSIVVGTPGRLLELLKNPMQYGLRLNKVEMLILDEADRILDLGFESQINAIFRFLPSQRRTGLFSATQTKELKSLVKAGLRNPVKVEVKTKSKQATPMELKNFYTVCQYDDKLNLLIDALRKRKDQKTMVYFLTCACVDYFFLLTDLLNKKYKLGLDLKSLHGQMVQKRREKTYEEFINSKNGILFCTDVAARGLDIPDVNFIVQFDAPNNPSSFVHRSGRTARMGNSGDALIFISEKEDAFVDYLEIKKVPLIQEPLPENLKNYHEDVKSFVKKDRQVYELSMKALQSFVRGYKEHVLNYIFNLKTLDFDGLCILYGMLEKPRLRECKNIKFTRFKPDLSFDTEKIKFKDKKRQSAYLKRVAKKEKKTKEKEEKDKSEPQEKRSATFSEMKMAVRQNLTIKTKRRKQAYEDIEQDELEFQAAMLRKLKRRKISEDEYAKLTGEAEFNERFPEEFVAAKPKSKSKKRKRKQH